MAVTSCGLTWPISTIRAMSTVSASVTRRPSRNSAVLPSRAISALICGPPPWTTTGRMPTRRISTMSWANRSSASWSDVPARALPPYLTTTVLPAKRRMYGSASTRTWATVAVDRRVDRRLTAPGRRAGGRRSRRGRGRRWPTAAAPPEAPLVRLSRAHRAIDVAGALVVAGRDVGGVGAERGLGRRRAVDDDDERLVGVGLARARRAATSVDSSAPAGAGRSRWPGSPGSSGPGGA